jgi:hypothetical protein
MAERGLTIPLLQLFTRRTGALLRWPRKRGILYSVKDPQHGRFDLWDRGLGQGSQSAAGARASGSWAALSRPRFPWFLWDWSGRISPASEMMAHPTAWTLYAEGRYALIEPRLDRVSPMVLTPIGAFGPWRLCRAGDG